MGRVVEEAAPFVRSGLARNADIWWVWVPRGLRGCGSGDFRGEREIALLYIAVHPRLTVWTPRSVGG